MDLLTAILTCSLYPSDDALVRAIAEGPSASNPYLVLNAAVAAAQDPAPPPPSREAEAIARATELLVHGGHPLLGLLQVPPAWLEVFARPLASAFDPCTNIAVGTAMLSEFDRACAPKTRAAGAWAHELERVNRRACVLRRYEAALGVEDFAEAVLLELSVQRPASPPLEEAPIFAPPSAAPWGPDQLLVVLPGAPPPARPPPMP
jgi:hypothetical protein